MQKIIVSTSDHLRLVRWISANIMPHEPAVRAWLSRALVSAADIDDLVQEAYCRLSAIEAPDQIARPDGYFFQIVRNLLREQVRRSQLVRIDAGVAIDSLPFDDERPSPERIASAKDEWRRVQAAMDALPVRCRDILRLRKIEGLSQKEIAQRLGISESIVENDAVKGLRLIQQRLGWSPPKQRSSRGRAVDDQARNRR